MAHNHDLLLSIRKNLNDTRQDRVCRAFLAKRGNPALVPYLGSENPAYFFLGTSPAGYDIAETPTHAEEYLDWAFRYFAQPDTDKASFQSYLPYAANHSGDYAAFGESAGVAHLVPIVTQRSAEITLPLVRACWPRTRSLLLAMKPKMILCHGSLAWKFLTGQEEGSENHLLDLPEWLKMGIAEIYDKVEADKLAFTTRILEFPDDYRPWIVPLSHLGGASGGKDARKKGEAAVARARRGQSGEGAAVSVAGSRIRVRRVT